ncbi:hypothetical protein [Actinoplanes palleronii]|uniref:hypothetical protein n=1 Tax=Actinoplanes palleronii TaxID=113570 RepID=UPI0019445C05|nr:hypothetical protein [Actinoplanes palleronii]
MMILVLKLALAPLLVVGSSLAGRRWGDRVTGTLVAFPIVAGPILLITCLEQGVHFGARAAAASLLGLVSLAVFAVIFAYASSRRTWPLALVISWSASILADVVLALRPVGVLGALLLVLAVIAIAHRLVATMNRGIAGLGKPAPPWWDLPGRALATAVLVLFVTGIAATAGPVVTGILAPFPIATSVVAAFVLAQQGSPAVIRTLAGAVQGLLGFAVFCFLVAVLVVPIGIPAAFGTALVGALLTQLAWRLTTGRRSRSAAGRAHRGAPAGSHPAGR